MVVARKVATCVGLPESTKFCDFHPAKLFDFSTRARCVVGFRCVGVRSGGAEAGSVVGLDLEHHPGIRDAESTWLARALGISQDALHGLLVEMRQLDDDIAGVEAMLAAGVQANDDLKMSKEEVEAMARAQLEGLRRSKGELQKKVDVAQEKVNVDAAKQKEWQEKLPHAAGIEQVVPILPVGDSVMEPFWPQGLGSNRGFHTALDAAWAVHLTRAEGIFPALLERQFWFDIMVQVWCRQRQTPPAASREPDPHQIS